MQKVKSNVARLAILVATMSAAASVARGQSVPAVEGGVEAPLKWVNALQGTNSVREFSHGNVYPLVCAPFGMTDWSVQNYGDASERFFFQSRRKTFVGIRATHQPSPWAGDYGHFLVTWDPLESTCRHASLSIL